MSIFPSTVKSPVIELTSTLIIASAVPSKVANPVASPVNSIFLGVVSLLELPLTLPVTLPIKLPSKVSATKIPRLNEESLTSIFPVGSGAYSSNTLNF